MDKALKRPSEHFTILTEPWTRSPWPFLGYKLLPPIEN